LNNENKEIVAGTTTDENGKFNLKTDEHGKFSLKITFVGFTDYEVTILQSSDLGTITLKTDNKLEEIVIVGRKKIIERKAGKLIFNVQSVPFLEGSDGIANIKKNTSYQY